jgi:hypothetical protein
MSKMSIGVGFGDLAAAATRPGTAFVDRRPVTASVMAAFVSFCVVLGLLLFAVGWVNPPDLRLAEGADGESAVVVSGSIFRGPMPAARLWFPVYWLAYIAFVTFWRSLAMLIMGAERQRWVDVLLASLLAAGPVVLIAAVQGIMNQAFPLDASSAPAWLVAVRVVLSLLLLVFAVVYEAVLWTRLSGSLLEFGGARAFLAWLVSAGVAAAMVLSICLFF